MSSSSVNINTLIETIMKSKTKDAELKAALSTLNNSEENRYDFLPEAFTDVACLLGLFATIAVYFFLSHLKFRIDQLAEETKQIRREQRKAKGNREEDV